jgi:hypothetical protein
LPKNISFPKRRKSYYEPHTLQIQDINERGRQTEYIYGYMQYQKATMYFVFKKIKISNLLISVFVLSVLWTPINAQKRNRSERYIDAYKKYLNATCPIKKDSIKHFVYFAKDRELIKDHPFLSHSRFKGAQIMYAWRELEPEKGKYDFSILMQDYEIYANFSYCMILRKTS